MDRKYYFALSFLIMISVITIFLATRPQVVKHASQLTTQPVVPQPTPAVLSVAAYACQKGKTPFDILADMAKVESQGSSSGQIVTSINDSSQGGGKQWTYTVDNKEATVSASSYICQDEEVVRWELK